jgi:DNA adenine methylase
MTAAGPVVKWVGGKTKLLPELLARMPKTYGTYFEPFAGGLALFFRVAPARAVLNDLNAGLVGLYRTIAANVAPVIAALEAHKRDHSEAHYYAAREEWNSGHGSPAQRSALFIYLNKTCFNGLWRVNRKGEFNVPMGRYDDPRICDADGLRAAAAALATAELMHGDYRACAERAVRGDFVYFDSPYDDTFTAYTADSFGSAQQHELAELARTLVARGVRVMLSNSDTPFVRQLYRGFHVDRVKCARAINSNTAKRGAVDEVIVTGGYRIARPRAASAQTALDLFAEGATTP